jgi:uncharacterized protein YgiM (DUF1202 family)
LFIKTFIWYYILSLIIFLSSITVLLPNLALAECGIVATNFTSLNIRSRPTERSRVVGKAHKGSALRIFNYRGSWVRVKLNNGRTGYASGDYISSGYCSIVHTRSGRLNIRSRPTKRSNIVDRRNSWSRVLLNNGRMGYVSNDYLY